MNSARVSFYFMTRISKFFAFLFWFSTLKFPARPNQFRVSTSVIKEISNPRLSIELVIKIEAGNRAGVAGHRVGVAGHRVGVAGHPWDGGCWTHEKIESSKITIWFLIPYPLDLALKLFWKEYLSVHLINSLSK